MLDDSRIALGRVGGRAPRAVLHAVFACALVLSASTALAQQPSGPPAVAVHENGTMHVPAASVPASDLLSPEGKAYLAEHLRDMQRPPAEGQPSWLDRALARHRELYKVEAQTTKIGGIDVIDYRPSAGISSRNQKRVLINLHGGGFAGCWPACAEAESRPIAALARVRVVSVDYRQWPEAVFPAASEDVAAVYRELLKTHAAKNIGIYGCSAGGMLAGMASAWFQKHDLPQPGAIGIFCAGAALPDRQPIAGFGGDADYTAAPLGEARLPPPAGGIAPLLYLENADPHDPLVAPAASDAVLARFPPTLIITGTRAFELSSAVYTHTQLVRLGVEAELHVWDGMFHGFYYNPDVPESREAYNVMTTFFDRWLER